VKWSQCGHKRPLLRKPPLQERETQRLGVQGEEVEHQATFTTSPNTSQKIDGTSRADFTFISTLFPCKPRKCKEYSQFSKQTNRKSRMGLLKILKKIKRQEKVPL